jgi:hypothetical protein
MSEPMMTIPFGTPLDRTALDAMSIHLHDGCIFQPVFRTSEEMGPTGKVVLSAVLVAVQLVKPAAIPLVAPAPRVLRGKARPDALLDQHP